LDHHLEVLEQHLPNPVFEKTPTSVRANTFRKEGFALDLNTTAAIILK
jgi:hypothetical protein